MESGVTRVTVGRGPTAAEHRAAARPGVPPGPVSNGVPSPVAMS